MNLSFGGRERKWTVYLHSTQSPHGGRNETGIKIAFLILVSIIIVEKVQAHRRRHPPDPPPTPAAVAEILTQAKAAQDAFLAKGSVYAPTDLADLTERLITLRDSLPEANAEAQRTIQEIVEREVHGAMARSREAMDSARSHEQRVRANVSDFELHRALSARASAYQHRKFAESPSILPRLAMFLGRLYLLFIPFMFLILAARVMRYQLSFLDEIIYGWKRLLLSAAFWPFGLETYPRDPAAVIRERYVRQQYAARMGKEWFDLTPDDLSHIQEIVRAPKAEMQARLDAIRVLPWHVLLKLRLALYASMIAGFLFTSTRFARADASVPAAQNTSAPVAVVVPEESRLEIHGFAQVGMTLPRADLQLTRAWLMADARQMPGVAAHIKLAVGPEPKLLEAFATVTVPRTPIGFRLGQMPLRSTFQTPRPDQERLIGGPGVGQFFHFRDIGAEIFVSKGCFTGTMALLSGAGINTPDNNADKDFALSAACLKLGPTDLQASIQFGEQPTGLRISSSASVTVRLQSLELNAVGAFLSMGDAKSGGVSTMIAWRSLTWLDVASGYDLLWPAHGPPQHVVRLQTTLLGFRDRIRLGLMGLWNSATSFGGTVRLQFSF